MKPVNPQSDEPSSTPPGDSDDPIASPREIDFAQLETPAELLPPRRETSSGAFDSADDDIAPIERERPVRPPLVPRVVWLLVALAFALVALGIAAVVTVNRAALVRVPTVTGQSVGIANNMLAQVGLKGRVAERRFSPRPPEEVLAQTPAAGSRVPEGDSIDLVVSGGTEELVMPDVIGDGIALARGSLEARGLVVEIEAVPSDEPSGTVIDTTPASGTVVRSGDVIRVEVAASLVGGATLQPYIMLGKTFVIDPGPASSLKSDVTLDIARRLRALLEASQARVVVTRSSAAASVDDRSQAAEATSATAGVGISVRLSGPGGRTVAGPLKPLDLLEASRPLVNALDEQLDDSVPPSSKTPKADEKALGDVTYPWARVSIGSVTKAQDKSAFSDPDWLDRVAKSLYTALGEVYGIKERQ